MSTIAPELPHFLGHKTLLNAALEPNTPFSYAVLCDRLPFAVPIFVHRYFPNTRLFHHLRSIYAHLWSSIFLRQAMIDEFDLDQDGEINEQEFFAIMTDDA